MIKKELLDILACPLGKKPLKIEGKKLVCTECGLRFSVKDGIPVMLVDEAELPEGAESIEQLSCYQERRKAEGGRPQAGD